MNNEMFVGTAPEFPKECEKLSMRQLVTSILKEIKCMRQEWKDEMTNVMAKVDFVDSEKEKVRSVSPEDKPDEPSSSARPLITMKPIAHMFNHKTPINHSDDLPSSHLNVIMSNESASCDEVQTTSSVEITPHIVKKQKIALGTKSVKIPAKNFRSNSAYVDSFCNVIPVTRGKNKSVISTLKTKLVLPLAINTGLTRLTGSTSGVLMPSCKSNKNTQPDPALGLANHSVEAFSFNKKKDQKSQLKITTVHNNKVDSLLLSRYTAMQHSLAPLPKFPMNEIGQRVMQFTDCIGEGNTPDQVESKAGVPSTASRRKRSIKRPKRQPHYCKVCDRLFWSLETLNYHNKIHTGLKPYQCRICEESFLDHTSLRNHAKIHVISKPFACNVCQKRFTAESYYKMHIRTHSDDFQPLSCNTCSKVFAQSGDLNRHMATHVKDKQFSCEVCEKCFYTKKRLACHTKTHTNRDKLFACKLCDKKFSYNSALHKHLRIHTGEKPFVCNVCARSFSQNGTLKLHMRLHTGEKPYHCEVCDKRFALKHNLKAHSSVHVKEIESKPTV